MKLASEKLSWEFPKIARLKSYREPTFRRILRNVCVEVLHLWKLAMSNSILSDSDSMGGSPTPVEVGAGQIGAVSDVRLAALTVKPVSQTRIDT